MNEALLQYLWKYKKLKFFDFRSTENVPIEVLDFGEWNQNSGPDFSMAKIKIGSVTWVGNIEMHVKSSDWLQHQHSGNPEFENLILHVVFHHDVEIPEFIERKIPTLELKNYIDENLLWKYAALQEKENFIPCENIFSPSFVPFQFAEETLLKKLDDKSEIYSLHLKQNKNDYEALLFQQLSYAFGLKINAEIFQNLACSIDFNTLRKIGKSHFSLEALLFGLCGWLSRPTDEMTEKWSQEFQFLKSKFSLPQVNSHPKFSKLHPQNFPTLRLSQLANLYSSEQNLFSTFIHSGELNEVFKILKKVKASSYWDHHFVFGKSAEKKYPKFLSDSFIHILLYNCILPIRYFFMKNHDEDAAENILKQYETLPPEKNSIITKWKKLGIDFENGLQTQAFLYHYKNFCKNKKCLTCGIGFQLLKNA